MGTFAKFNERRPRRVWAGIVARAVNGERVTMALVDLEPDAPLPEHHHENEQLGFVVQGELVLTVGDETQRLGPGDTYVIPSNVSHTGLTGPEGAVVCDVFAPTREDWDKIPEDEPSPSAWKS